MVHKIRKLCRDRNKTLQELEKELGFGFRTVEQWDDHTPAVDRVWKVAQALGVTVEYLMADEPEHEEVAQ